MFRKRKKEIEDADPWKAFDNPTPPAQSRTPPGAPKAAPTPPSRGDLGARLRAEMLPASQASPRFKALRPRVKAQPYTDPAGFVGFSGTGMVLWPWSRAPQFGEGIGSPGQPGPPGGCPHSYGFQANRDIGAPHHHPNRDTHRHPLANQNRNPHDSPLYPHHHIYPNPRVCLPGFFHHHPGIFGTGALCAGNGAPGDRKPWEYSHRLQ